MKCSVRELNQSSEKSFFLIAGPCAVESEEITKTIAGALKELCERLDIPLVFKASFRKANRTDVSSFTGIGDEEALNILNSIREDFELPITTDVHEVNDIEIVKELVDIIQIPAFLCRQTDLILAAGKTGLTVNIKKGQFMSGNAMIKAAEKVKFTGNENVLLTERGNFYGYEDLVVDSRNVWSMSREELTIIDVTHSNQRPNQTAGITGGSFNFSNLIGRVGIASGAKGIFLETHTNTNKALSDSATMIPLEQLENMLRDWKLYYKATRDIYG